MQLDQKFLVAKRLFWHGSYRAVLSSLLFGNVYVDSEQDTMKKLWRQ